ncbi:DMT family transporter [Carnobacterium pleistocenium]|uniref:DMT family transporter n=1 Tax=Carnobacterium pleistocenium TaxID=181073 RepID=UPI0005583358|nr:DMT family transporter [Carnobacterium pleistocenium]
MGIAKMKVVTAMLLFGSIGLMVKNIELTSSEIALYRGVLGSLFLLLFLLLKKKKVSRMALKSNALILLFSGAAIGLNWILLFEAYNYTTIANATLSYYFAPVIVMIFSPFLLKEKLQPNKAVSILAAMLGMFLIVGTGTQLSGNYMHSVGILYGLGAAVLYASVIMLNKLVKDLTSLESTMIQLMMASVTLAPYVFFTQGFDLVAIEVPSIPYLIILGIIHTGVAYVLYFSAMQKLKSQTVALLSYIDPVAAVAMSALFLGEKMSGIQVIGGLLILSSTLIGGIKWSNKEAFAIKEKTK